MKSTIFILVIFCALLCDNIYAQGPPITSDKPLMIGGKRGVVRTLSEVRNLPRGSILKVPLMIHYLPTSNTFIGAHVPFLYYNNSSKFGDLSIVGKYQLVRKDTTGSTFRMALKLRETFPTGVNTGMPDLSFGKWQSYIGIIAGKECLRHGVLGEIGYNKVHNSNRDELRGRLGFGLPLLKPKYPVNQINLYFEYAANWLIELQGFELLYAQGLQYAFGGTTVEMAIQWPLVQKSLVQNRNYSIYLGARYVF